MIQYKKLIGILYGPIGNGGTFSPTTFPAIASPILSPIMLAKEGSSCRRDLSIRSWQRCRNSCPIFPKLPGKKPRTFFNFTTATAGSGPRHGHRILPLPLRSFFFFRTAELSFQRNFPNSKLSDKGERGVESLAQERGKNNIGQGRRIRYEFRNVCTPGILDVCKMAGHTCV